jgi:hypothetical protein
VSMDLNSEVNGDEQSASSSGYLTSEKEPSVHGGHRGGQRTLLIIRYLRNRCLEHYRYTNFFGRLVGHAGVISFNEKCF